MSKFKRIIYVLGGIVLFLLIAYLIYTGSRVSISEGQA